MPRPRTIVSVVGTRPNFMKTVPVARALRARPDEFRHVLVHTGQHYDRMMSDVFFEELGVGPPDHLLEVGGGSHAQTTGRVMERLEPLLQELRPDLVLVPGDVNSTLAAALTAAKLRIPVGHIEAGLRSFDRSMPEEVNRVLTDQVSDLLFVHSPEAVGNLEREGRAAADVFSVGNTMIDTLVAMRDRIAESDTPRQLGLGGRDYVVVTLHRPALVDGPLLGDVMSGLAAVAHDSLEVVFPMHPRTRSNLERADISAPEVRVVEPLGYVDFLGLLGGARGVLTDSGGIQEETTYLGVPCFTLRDNTERPVTVELGTNVLLGLAPERIREIPERLAATNGARTRALPGWDGHAAERLTDVLAGLEDYRRL